MLNRGLSFNSNICRPSYLHCRNRFRDACLIYWASL